MNLAGQKTLKSVEMSNADAWVRVSTRGRRPESEERIRVKKQWKNLNREIRHSWAVPPTWKAIADEMKPCLQRNGSKEVLPNLINRWYDLGTTRDDRHKRNDISVPLTSHIANCYALALYKLRGSDDEEWLLQLHKLVSLLFPNDLPKNIPSPKEICFKKWLLHDLIVVSLIGEGILLKDEEAKNSFIGALGDNPQRHWLVVSHDDDQHQRSRLHRETYKRNNDSILYEYEAPAFFNTYLKVLHDWPNKRVSEEVRERVRFCLLPYARWYHVFCLPEARLFFGANHKRPASPHNCIEQLDTRQLTCHCLFEQYDPEDPKDIHRVKSPNRAIEFANWLGEMVHHDDSRLYKCADDFSTFLPAQNRNVQTSNRLRSTA